MSLHDSNGKVKIQGLKYMKQKEAWGKVMHCPQYCLNNTEESDKDR